MPFAKNRDVRIHYQVEGEGMPLVLLNGWVGGALDWYDAGYVAQLKHHHQLILIDMRGSGKSDKFYDAAHYDYETRATDIIAVLDALKIPKAIFVGFSQGGFVGYPLAGNFPERIAAMVLIGAEPQFQQRAKSHLTPLNAKEYIEEVIHAAVAQSAGFYKAKQLRRWTDCDLLALVAAVEGNKPSFMHYLPRINMPCLLIAGENDPCFKSIQAAVGFIKNGQFAVVPAMDHIGSLLRSDIIIPIMIDYLAKYNTFRVHTEAEHNLDIPNVSEDAQYISL